MGPPTDRRATFTIASSRRSDGRIEGAVGAGDGEKSVRPIPKLTPDQVNYLNIGLMLVSAGLAFWLPFQLFLFVYAVLGSSLADVQPVLDRPSREWPRPADTEGRSR
jgi:hypothetical protein